MRITVDPEDKEEDEGEVQQLRLRVGEGLGHNAEPCVALGDPQEDHGLQDEQHGTCVCDDASH